MKFATQISPLINLLNDDGDDVIKNVVMISWCLGVIINNAVPQLNQELKNPKNLHRESFKSGTAAGY